MANEKKTERIVYSHFEKFKDIIHIEEQSSDISKIDKLLKTASKKGMGKGRPEFLITYNKNLDLLIVIECKAETSKHESPNRDKYGDYAVDGVLLYASYLSKDFDVLAIAVSGETTQQLRVSHFLHLKNERKATEIFGDKLLPAQDYLDGYLKSPEKFRQDYNTLLAFTKKLNEKLHTYKILESQRSLLISCILIALEDDAFKTSYTKKTTPKNLADFLTKTVSEKLEEANISGKRLENLNTQFGFIKTDTSLSTKDKVLKELIDEIEENINQFIKTHEYFDVLGQLYIEFLRYANSDKGLGIVLTPPHITELFAELAQVNKNSIAYDNCTGTGGFLISAMKKMIEKADGDSGKIKEIKSTQLVGVEYQSHIFALAVSNMYIHQDGKTNIINGSCFDEGVIDEVKAKKPTVGFLNPPYKGNKKNDVDELEFILNNLECLVDGGICVAIVPMERALATSGKTLELKKRLLAKHTLEAVLSMPDDLFSSSKASSVTCVMIFKAHKSHDSSVETYFGYYKNDGFEKRKHLGRINVFGKWEAISTKWVNYFRRGKEEAGFSVKKTVTANDDWSVENYLETDYSILSKEHFVISVRDYLSFCIKEGYLDLFNNFTSQTSFEEIDLNVENWTYFKLTDEKLFEIKKGKRLTKEDFIEGKTPFIGAIDSNNGYRDFIEQDPIHKENTITINYNGSVAESFYQPKPFWASDDVNVLYPKFALNPFIALFLTTIISLEKFRFNYGRKWGLLRMQESLIKLPAKNGKPDFEFMENYIKNLNISKS
jgi:type I restriction enzyme M protein